LSVNLGKVRKGRQQKTSARVPYKKIKTHFWREMWAAAKDSGPIHMKRVTI